MLRYIKIMVNDNFIMYQHESNMCVSISEFLKVISCLLCNFSFMLYFQPTFLSLMLFSFLARFIFLFFFFLGAFLLSRELVDRYCIALNRYICKWYTLTDYLISSIWYLSLTLRLYFFQFNRGSYVTWSKMQRECN